MMAEGILAGVFGAIAGSVINMLGYRLPRNLSTIKPRSMCTSCNATLTPINLIPIIGYLVAGGKCTKCKNPIPLRYPLVELAFIGLSVWLWTRYGMTVEYGVYLTGFFALMTIFVSDLETKIIPDSMNLLLGGVGLYWGWLNLNLVDHLMGFSVAYLVFFGISFIAKLAYKQEALGGGDIKLAGAIGAFLGLKFATVALFLAFLTGGVVGGLLLVFKIKSRKDYIPFGPFMCLGAVLGGIWGEQFWTLFFG